MCTTDEWNTFAALCYHAFFFGTIAQSRKTWGGSFQLAVFLKSLIHRFHTLELIKTPLVKKRTKKGSIAKVWKISETDSKKYLQSKNIFLNFYLQYFLCFCCSCCCCLHCISPNSLENFSLEPAARQRKFQNLKSD